MDWFKKWGAEIGCVVLSVGCVVALSTRGCVTTDTPVVTAGKVVSSSVHSLMDGYAKDFAAASAEVGKSITTDTDLQIYLENRTKSTRLKAAAPVDALIQEKLPRDIDKLNAESAAFLRELSEAFASEAKSHE